MKKIAKYIYRIYLFIYWTVRNLLEDKKIYDYTIRPSSKIGKKVMIRSGNEIGNIAIGDFSYISGPRSYIEDAIIGKYCSIARQVVIGVSGHNYNWVTTSPIITSAKYGFINKDVPEPQKGIPIIGNDVWVGMNVIIMRGVKIGDGAVIAAGSIVTSDVLPYSIVAGIPAKHQKFRFADDKIKMLLEMQWWDWSIEKIKSQIPDLYSVDTFIKNYSQQE